MPTTRRNQTGNTTALQGIPPNTPGGSGTPGGGGGGTAVNRPAPAPTGPAPLLGEPEFIPQHTFISAAQPNDNGFIANALNFHNNVSLRPRTVGSIEEILELLANPAETGSGVLDRIRIVSHFFVPDPGEPDQPSNMGINFLRNGGRGALKRFFEGFAQSSIAGLRALLVFDLVGGQSALTIFNSPETLVLSAVRAAGQGAAVDAVFPPAGTPSDNKKEFVILHAARWVLAHGMSGIADATLRANLTSAYDLLLTDLRPRLIAAPDNVPGPQLDALAAAIAGLANLGGAQVVSPANLARYAANVAAGLAAFAGDAFRNKMLAVRPRFDRFTTIDIRGCRAGTDMAYLAAVQAFFGRTGSVRPVVTAPNFFQRFNQISATTMHGQPPQGLAATINGLHNSGIPPTYTAAQVRTQFGVWADGFGIGAAHLTFWHTTFQLGVLEFCKLQWRAGIPARRVTISRLDALPGVAFADLFNRLGDIFLVRVAQRPTAAQLGVISPKLGNLNTWTTQLDAAIDPTSTAAQLSAHFTNYKTIYEAVEARMSNASFHNSPQRIVPPTEPASFTVAKATTMRTNLRNFIQTNANSIFAPVRVFLAAADANTQDAPARMRYFLALGLVFQLAHTTSVDFNVQILVLLDDGTGGGPHHEAIRHWMRAGWRGVAPPTIAPGLDFNLARHSQWVVSDRTQGPAGVCPHPSYMSHIVTQPA
ncbi:hypothetical protein [Cupriavidus sp. DF5525]|uniref:hypothetical protein n=1 Tax=Cupriavidus sp. DF5525 TaxID=3160989 RepID=UPI0003B0BEF4|nr:hypothetical protein N234_09790 [Ralstonia pickettii DTP0602]